MIDRKELLADFDALDAILASGNMEHVRTYLAGMRLRYSERRAVVPTRSAAVLKLVRLVPKPAGEP